MRLRRAVLSSTSPRGVAPPVSDDCAPIGSTDDADRITAATSASDAGVRDAGGEPAGKVRGVLEKRGQHVRIASDRTRRRARVGLSAGSSRSDGVTERDRMPAASRLRRGQQLVEQAA